MDLIIKSDWDTPALVLFIIITGGVISLIYLQLIGKMNILDLSSSDGLLFLFMVFLAAAFFLLAIPKKIAEIHGNYVKVGRKTINFDEIEDISLKIKRPIIKTKGHSRTRIITEITLKNGQKISINGDIFILKKIIKRDFKEYDPIEYKMPKIGLYLNLFTPLIAIAIAIMVVAVIVYSGAIIKERLPGGGAIVDFEKQRELEGKFAAFMIILVITAAIIPIFFIGKGTLKIDNIGITIGDKAITYGNIGYASIYWVYDSILGRYYVGGIYSREGKRLAKIVLDDEGFKSIYPIIINNIAKNLI